MGINRAGDYSPAVTEENFFEVYSRTVMRKAQKDLDELLDVDNVPQHERVQFWCPVCQEYHWGERLEMGVVIIPCESVPRDKYLITSGRPRV